MTKHYKSNESFFQRLSWGIRRFAPLRAFSSDGRTVRMSRSEALFETKPAPFITRAPVGKGCRKPVADDHAAALTTDCFWFAHILHCIMGIPLNHSKKQ